MKYFLYLIAAICSPMIVFCQDITGLWKGTMFNDSTKQALPYEVVIAKENGKYSGFSHSWFLIDGKKYYGIKKVKIRIATDGKIIIQDAVLVEDNYPVAPNKNVGQLNVLDIAILDNEIKMDGQFVTNRTKAYSELTGSISIKKVSPSAESALMQYFQKNGIDNGLTAAK
jgi:hypothetical protein